MGWKSKGIFSFVLAASYAGAAYADQVAVIPASGDATLFGGADAMTNNSGSGPGMFVGSDGTNPKRGLIEFNIASAVPAGATITSASLTLYLGMVAGAGGNATGGSTTPRTINLYTVSDSWHSGGNTTPGSAPTYIGGTGHGAAPKQGDPTWNYSAYNTAAWTNPGGDFSTTVSSSLTDTSTWSTGEAYTWASTPLMVSNVQAWLNGTTSNDGWLLQNTVENSQSFRAFYTAEGAADINEPQYAPELTVDFIPAPEPATGALFLIAAPLLLRRRARSA
jgi:hypothetical protein